MKNLRENPLFGAFLFQVFKNAYASKLIFFKKSRKKGKNQGKWVKKHNFFSGPKNAYASKLIFSKKNHLFRSKKMPMPVSLFFQKKS